MDILNRVPSVLHDVWDAVWPRWTIAAVALFLIYVVFRKYFQRHKIQDTPFDWKQFRHEIAFSFLTLSFGNLIGFATELIVTSGVSTVLKTPVNLATLFLIIGQFFLYFVLFDIYFYFMHRLFHTKLLYWMHKYHHRSVVPDPLSAFSFHPLEALLTGGFVPLMVLIFHLHLYAIIAATTFGVLNSVLIHSGHEVFPRWWYRKDSFSRFYLSPMFHDRHHSTYRYNFGGFTTIWDRVFGTMEPEFGERYNQFHLRVSGPRSSSQQQA